MESTSSSSSASGARSAPFGQTTVPLIESRDTREKERVSKWFEDLPIQERKEIRLFGRAVVEHQPQGMRAADLSFTDFEGS